MNKRSDWQVTLWLALRLTAFVLTAFLALGVTTPSQAEDDAPNATEATDLRLFPFFPGNIYQGSALYIGNGIDGENSGEIQYIPASGGVPLAPQPFQLDGLEVIQIDPASQTANDSVYSVEITAESPTNPLVAWKSDFIGRPGMIHAVTPAQTLFAGPFTVTPVGMALTLKNPATTSITGTFEFLNLDGSAAASPQSFDLGPHTGLVYRAYENPELSEDFVGWARVTASGPLGGLVSISRGSPLNREYYFIEPAHQPFAESPSAQTATVQTINAAQAVESVLVPRLFRHVEEGGTTRTSHLLVGNPFTSTTNITVTLHPTVGADITLTSTALSALQAAYFDLGTIAGLANGVYAATVTSDQAVYVAQATIPEVKGGWMLGSYGSDAANSILLPHVDKNDDAYSFIAIQSTACGAGSPVTLDFLQDGAESVHSESVTVPCTGWTRINLRTLAALGDEFSGALQVTQSASGAVVSAVVDTYRNAFSPIVDGYSFANHGIGDLPWEVYTTTFGAEQVVASDGTPKLFAERSYEQTRSQLQGGLGFAMAASSALIQKGWLSPTVTASSTYSIAEPPVDPADAELWLPAPASDFLAQVQLYQLGRQWKSAQSAVWQRPLADEAATIVSSLDGLSEPRLISLVGPATNGACASHTLVPYGYQKNGNDLLIAVYDPDHPGALDRQITVNLSDNTWQYDGPYGLWQNGQLCQAGLGAGADYASKLVSTPLAVLRQSPTPVWPIASAPAVTVSLPLQFIHTEMSATLLITAASGLALGNRNGAIVEEIPGSYLDLPLSGVPGQAGEPAESYVVSSTLPLTLSLRHSQPGRAGLAATVEGNRYVALAGESTHSGDGDLLVLQPDHRVTLSTGYASPNRTLAVGVALEDAERLVTISGLSLPAQQVAEVATDATLQVVTFTTQVSTTYVLHLIEQSDASDEQVQSAAVAARKEFSVTVSNQQGVQTLAVNWTSPEESTLSIDNDADGVVDQEIDLGKLVEPEKTRLALPFVTKE